MKQLYTYIFATLALLIVSGVFTTPTSAFEKTSGVSATFVSPAAIVKAEQKRDYRVQQLQKFLESYNSPLAASAETFITEADRNNLDWKFVAAIAGVESGFGKAIPFNSYNGWGWGIYGTNSHSFKSWNDGIITISKGLRENYMNKWGATDVQSIGRIYAASPTWAYKVQYFMNKIEAFQSPTEIAILPISL